MPRPVVPDFASLLGPLLAPLPAASRPGLLARLERVAGERYRGWAEAWPEQREALLACAEREHEIAHRAERLVPVPAEDEAAVAAAAEQAGRLYADTFEGHDLRTQLFLQAHAERQGAQAWRAHAAALAAEGDTATSEGLAALADLEEASADSLDQLLGIRSRAPGEGAVSADATRPAAG